MSILVCVNAVVIIGEYRTKWSKQRKIIVKGGGSILFYYCNYLPLCIMTRRSSYRKLWSILKNVEMNHNKRALTRNRCQWSVNISWPGKGRYIYTCTTLIGNNFYCVLKSSTLNQNKARFKVWIKQKLALYRTNLIWMTFLHQCKHLFSMLSCIGSVTEIHCWRLCKIFLTQLTNW